MWIVVSLSCGILLGLLAMRWRRRHVNVSYAHDLANKLAVHVNRQSTFQLKRFRAGVDMCSDSILLADVETLKVVDATSVALYATGYSLTELKEMSAAQLLNCSALELRSLYQKVLDAGPEGLLSESHAVSKEGRVLDIEVHRHALKVDGRWTVVSVSRDITQRKTAERTAQRLSRLYAVLSETNEAIIRLAEPKDLYQSMCEAAVRSGLLLAASVWLPSSSSTAAVLAAAAGEKAAELGSIQVQWDAVPGHLRDSSGGALHSGEARIHHLLPDALQAAFDQTCGATRRVQSAARLGLMQHGDFIGVLLLQSAERDAFDEDVVALLERMARNIVFALENIDRDATRRAAEDQLRSTQARLDRATRGANDGHWELSVATRHMWVSPIFCDMLGLTRAGEGTQGEESVLDAIDPVSALMLRAALARCEQEGMAIDLELQVHQGQAADRWVRIRGALDRDANNRATMVSGSLQDISDDKAHQRAMAAATERADAANRSKSEFLANMSHEIRTPMNGVLGMTDLLLDTNLDAVQREYTEIAQHSAKSLLTVINEILDFSKIEAGKLHIESIDVDVRQTITAAVRLLESQAQARSLKIVMRIDPSIPEWLTGDPARLRQILLNLCSNALKFTSAGEIVIECQCIERTEGFTTIRIAVSDTGIGIPAARLAALFNPFTQADSSTTRRFGGTGLGLSIVKRLAELMGGEAGASSIEGQGSTFWVTLKLNERASLHEVTQTTHTPGHEVLLRVAPQEPEEPNRQFASPTLPTITHCILVAEDNAVNQKVVLRMLEKLGYRVEVTSDGRQALKAWQTGRFSLILMDCQMPLLDGYETTRAIRAQEERGRHIPIIALTAHAMREAEAQCIEAGMDDYLAKPINRDMLKRKMQHWLGDASIPLKRQVSAG